MTKSKTLTVPSPLTSGAASPNADDTVHIPTLRVQHLLQVQDLPKVA